MRVINNSTLNEVKWFDQLSWPKPYKGHIPPASSAHRGMFEEEESLEEDEGELPDEDPAEPEGVWALDVVEQVGLYL